MAGPYEIPAEMRDFAEKSVQQARKAFEGFMGAVQKSTSNVEEATQTTSQNLKDASVKAATYAEANVKAALDLAEKLVKAKDMQEVLALQSEFVKAQMESVQTQAKELGQTISDTMKSAVQPKK